MARVLVDSITLGPKAAAERAGITDRTLRRYRTRAESDEALSELIQQKLKRAEADWKPIATRFLRRSIAKLERLVEDATVEQIRQVAGAIKIVGDLQVVREALTNGEQPGASGEGEAHPADAGGIFGSVTTSGETIAN